MAPRERFQRFTAEDPARLEIEIERTRRDLEAAKSRHDRHEMLTQAASLGSMLTTARREEEGHRILVEYLAVSREQGTPEETGWLVHMLATANQYLDRDAEASRQFEEALKLAKAAGAERLEHFVLSHWGRFLVEQGDIERARQCFTQALELRVRLNDPRQASSRRALEAIANMPRAEGR